MKQRVEYMRSWHEECLRRIYGLANATDSPLRGGADDDGQMRPKEGAGRGAMTLRLSILVGLVAFVVLGSRAAVVHVYEQTMAGGVVNQLLDTIKDTGKDYVTQRAPSIVGYIFTGWSAGSDSDFRSRDVLGRSFDAAPYHLCKSMTLTANYLPESTDSDGDGIADGLELYWYGNLLQGVDSDTDVDGYTFVQELAAGTNPLLKDSTIIGGVAYEDSEGMEYNPNCYRTCVIRSDPEGALFSSITSTVRAGDPIETPNCAGREGFACWRVDGVDARDVLGRALDLTAIKMPNRDTELVAVCVNNEEDRAKIYWYGTMDVALDSDTDGDGYAFVQELAAGTNPLLKDSTIIGGVVYENSEGMEYNPNCYRTCVIRSEPEGSLFGSITSTVRAGDPIETPNCAGRDGFACWRVDGVDVRDTLGRAVDSACILMPNHDTEIVAVCVDNEEDRAKMYWCGTMDVSMDGDTDGDDYPFTQELVAGTNPLLKDRTLVGGIAHENSDEMKIDLQPHVVMDNAMVTGDARSGYTITPSANLENVEIDLNGINPSKVTIKVSSKVKTVAAKGATVKIVNAGFDITEFIKMPEVNAQGVIDLSKATIKEEIVKETLDPAKGAKIELNSVNPTLITPNTRVGLFYQLREGETLGGMKDGNSKVGDGQPWSPEITVKGGNSAFYSIGVGKGE